MYKRQRRFRVRRNNQQSTNTSHIEVLSNQDIVMDQELPQSDTRGLHLNSPDQSIINDPITDQVDMGLSSSLPYSNYQFKRAHKEFKDKFLNNSFGHPCSVCLLYTSVSEQ